MEGNEGRFETQGVVVSRRIWLAFVAMGALLGSCIGILLGEKTIQNVGFLVFLAAGFSVGRFLRRRPGRVVVDDRGVSLDEELLAPRASIRARSLGTAKNGMPRVSIAYRPSRLHLSMEVEVADQDVARALVRALPSSNEDTFFRARLFGTYGASLLWKLAVTGPVLGVTTYLVLQHEIPSWMLVVSFAMAFLVPSIAAMFTWITIGADGVDLREVIGHRFISFADIESIASDERGLTLLVRSARSARIPISAAQQRLQVESKIREGLERFQLGTVLNEPPTDIERRERSTRDWIAALRSIGSTALTDYRRAALSARDLARVVSDQNADPASRAASAIALDALEPKGRDRIRVAAAETANPKLRVALERIADHASDEEIEQDLELLSENKSSA